MTDHVQTLRDQAIEIAAEHHAGWGNTMTWAADEIERLRGALADVADAAGCGHPRATIVQIAGKALRAR